MFNALESPDTVEQTKEVADMSVANAGPCLENDRLARTPSRADAWRGVTRESSLRRETPSFGGAASGQCQDVEEEQSAGTITVAVVGDNRLMRESLTAMLNRLTDVRAVASTVADAAALGDSRPQVVLVDAGPQDQDSLHVALELKHDVPEAEVVVMDLLPVEQEILDLVNVGVSGFVLRDATFDEFVRTIRSVAAGEKVLPPRLTRALFSQVAKETNGRACERPLRDTRLTRRESEVIDLIGAGMCNREIAQRLDIATDTVRSHVRNVMEKLALHTRLQIAAYTHGTGPHSAA